MKEINQHCIFLYACCFLNTSSRCYPPPCPNFGLLKFKSGCYYALLSCYKWKQNSPEPLAAEAGNREDAPVYEDAKLGLIVPLWQRSGVDGFPVWLVFAPADADQQHR